MSNSERLKKLLEEVKQDVERMDNWMKCQEPPPGVPYEDWLTRSSGEQLNGGRKLKIG